MTFDEWTNINSIRFFNILIFTHSYYFNLGLVRINGKFDAEGSLKAVDDKLNEFGLSPWLDIAGITTDETHL